MEDINSLWDKAGRIITHEQKYPVEMRVAADLVRKGITIEQLLLKYKESSGGFRTNNRRKTNNCTVPSHSMVNIRNYMDALIRSGRCVHPGYLHNQQSEITLDEIPSILD